jgi:hypothetical protein
MHLTCVTHSTDGIASESSRALGSRNCLIPQKQWGLGSNPTRGMDVYVCGFSLRVFQCVGTALYPTDPVSKEGCRRCIGLRN